MEGPCGLEREELPPSSPPLPPRSLLHEHHSRRIRYQTRAKIQKCSSSLKEGFPWHIVDSCSYHQYGVCILVAVFYAKIWLQLLSGSWPVTFHSSWKSKHIIIMFPARYLWNPVRVLLLRESWCLNNAKLMLCRAISDRRCNIHVKTAAIKTVWWHFSLNGFLHQPLSRRSHLCFWPI